MAYETIKQKLATVLPVTKYSKNSEIALSETGRYIKIFNIRAFFSIDRNYLTNKECEHLLLIYSTEAGENVYIEYPGKESADEYASNGSNKIKNPYDFRPELYLKDETPIPRLSFEEIAASIKEYMQYISRDQLQILAALLIRMAFMEDYEFLKKEHERYEIIFENKKSLHSISRLNLETYSLLLDDELIQELATWPPIRFQSSNHNIKVPVLVSIEGMLYYMDLLAQQEDCKYCFLRKIKGIKEGAVGMGRINFLLTMVKIIDRLLQGRPIDDIIRRLKTKVDPIDPVNFERVTGGIITIRPDSGSIRKLDLSKIQIPYLK